MNVFRALSRFRGEFRMSELATVLDELLTTEVDVVTIHEVARIAQMSPATALVACEQLVARDPRYGLATAQDGVVLVYRVPPVGSQRKPLVLRMIERMQPGMKLDIGGTVQLLAGIRAAVRYRLVQAQHALRVLEQRRQALRDGQQTDGSAILRQSRERQEKYLLDRMTEIAALEAECYRYVYALDGSLDKLAALAASREFGGYLPPRQAPRFLPAPKPPDGDDAHSSPDPIL